MSEPIAVRELEDALREGELQLQGQFMLGSNYTFLVQVRHKGRELPAVYKPARGEQPLWDFPENTLARREVAAYLVSEALGFQFVPCTVLREDVPPYGTGSLQQYIEFDPEYHYFTFTAEDKARLPAVELFDVLVNNADRKGSHLLIEAGTRKLWAIDHGLCFHEEDKLRTVIWDAAGHAIPENLLASLAQVPSLLEAGAPLRLDLRPYLSTAEIEAMLRRSDDLLREGIFPSPPRHRRAFPYPPGEERAMHHRLAFIGFGNVARALVRLLERKRDLLRNSLDTTFSVTGIATGGHGLAVDPAGIDIQRALTLVASGASVSLLSTVDLADSVSVIRHSGADVMFENSPVNHSTGEPALTHVREALRLGMHAITANKGTVVHGYQELRSLAQSAGREFLFEATVLGGSPLFSVFRECMPLAQLLSFRGVLNSTTNIILTRMQRGETFDQAVRYCQSIGVAETDPSADVDGWDAAIKVAALVTVLMDIPLTAQQVRRTGIRDITPQMIEAAGREGRRYKLVCSAVKDGDVVRARVGPEMVTSADPLYAMDDSTTGVALRTDVLGDYSIVESERDGMVAGPEPTAYGLFADFVHAVNHH